MTDELKLTAFEADGTWNEEWKKLSFEKALCLLEQVTATLERGDLSLEQSILLYQRGSQLAQLCEKLLDNANRQISKWMPTEEAMEEVPFEELGL